MNFPRSHPVFTTGYRLIKTMTMIRFFNQYICFQIIGSSVVMIQWLLMQEGEGVSVLEWETSILTVAGLNGNVVNEGAVERNTVYVIPDVFQQCVIWSGKTWRPHIWSLKSTWISAMTGILYLTEVSTTPHIFCKYFIISFHVTTLKKWHFATM